MSGNLGQPGGDFRALAELELGCNAVFLNVLPPGVLVGASQRGVTSITVASQDGVPARCYDSLDPSNLVGAHGRPFVCVGYVDHSTSEFDLRRDDVTVV